MHSPSRRFKVSVALGTLLACCAVGGGIVAAREARFVKEVTSEPYTIRVAAVDIRELVARDSERLCAQRETCRDSLVAQYAKGFYLLLAIGPSTQARTTSEACGDIAEEALAQGRDGFFERVASLHFELNKHVFLELRGGKRIAPATCTFVRSYGLQNGTNEAMVVFSRDQLEDAGLTGRLVLTGLGRMRGEKCINLPLWRLL